MPVAYDIVSVAGDAMRHIPEDIASKPLTHCRKIYNGAIRKLRFRKQRWDGQNYYLVLELPELYRIVFPEQPENRWTTITNGDGVRQGFRRYRSLQPIRSGYPGPDDPVIVSVMIVLDATGTGGWESARTAFRNLLCKF